MYNGVGLETPRGSGTAGYVETNKFTAKPSASSAAAGGGTTAAASVKKPDPSIIEHERNRRIELKLLILREALEEHGYPDAEISSKVDEERVALEAADQ